MTDHMTAPHVFTLDRHDFLLANTTGFNGCKHSKYVELPIYIVQCRCVLKPGPHPLLLLNSVGTGSYNTHLYLAPNDNKVPGTTAVASGGKYTSPQLSPGL